VEHTFSSSVRLQNVIDYNPGFGNEPDFPAALIGFPIETRKLTVGSSISLP
jgi:hypothetical protein